MMSWQIKSQLEEQLDDFLVVVFTESGNPIGTGSNFIFAEPRP